MSRPFYHKFLGIPYQHLGRSFRGVDCYGLLLLYYKELFGIVLKDWWYEKDWSKKGCNYFLQNYTHVATKVTDPKIHDVVLFYIDTISKVTNHAAIIVEPNGIIQAVKSGVVYSNLCSPILQTRIEGYYRICRS